MPAIPVLVLHNVPNSQDLLARGLVGAGRMHVLVRRAVDHTALETIAVVITIFVSMGLVMYWGIIKQGSCTWRK